MIRLEDRFIDSLLAQLESGMGYPLIDVEQRDGKTLRGVAYNAELILLEGEPRSALKVSSYEQAVENARSSSGVVKAVRVRRGAGSAKAVRERAPTLSFRTAHS